MLVKFLLPWSSLKLRFRRGAILDLRKNEAITVEPLGVLGVEVHETVEKDVGNRSHAPKEDVSTYLRWREARSLPVELSCQRNLHGGTRVTGVGMGGGIGLSGKAVSMKGSYCRDPVKFPMFIIANPLLVVLRPKKTGSRDDDS